MKYIIEGVRKNGDQKEVSYLVERDKIRYLNFPLSSLLHKRLNIYPFKLAPGKIMHSYQFEQATIHEVKQQVSKLIQLGCTTVIAFYTIRKANELKRAVSKIRHQMINSAIDYCFGIRIPITQLTPELIHSCKRELIPIIHLQISSLNQLDTIAWQWLREALFHYSVVCMPEFQFKKMSEREQLQANVKWNFICETYRIPTTTKYFAENELYDRLTLQRIGLYPVKGILMVESDVDYYLSQTCGKTGIERIEVVVLRGKVIKAGKQIFYSAGSGRELKIKLPGRFQELASSTSKV